MFRFAHAISSRKDLDWCWFLRGQGRVGELLERALHDIGVMEPNGWADWAPSTMTQTGAPVELTFDQDETGLRILTEVADPASDPVNRLSQVYRTMAQLGGTPPNAAQRDVMSAAQSTGDLIYGARLGLRTRGLSLHTELFAELPSAATDLIALMWSAEIGDVIESCGADTSPSMLGYDGTTGRLQIHFTVRNPSTAILTPLADIARLSKSALVNAISRFSGPTDIFSTRQLGFSLAMQGQGKPPALTLYLPAATLFGTDSKITRHLGEHCTIPMPRYAGLIDILPRTAKRQTHHGMIGLTVRPNQAPSLSVAVAAPKFCPFELQ